MKKFLMGVAIVALSAGIAQAKNIGISMSLFDDNFLTVLRHNMQDYAKTLDGVAVQAEDAQGDISRQQSQIENFLASGVDGVIVMLVDADSGPAISAAAARAGVPLVFVNMAPTGVDNLPKNQAWVGSDEVQAGTLQAQEICRRLGGKGEAVVLMGQLGTTGQRGRTKAVHDVLATDECKGIKVLDEQTGNWMRTPGMDIMTNWITSGLKPDAVIANNDEMALGAIQALKSAGVPMKDVVIGGVDATRDALLAIQNGDLDVTVFQNARDQGRGALDIVLKLADGQSVGQKNYVPFELVTSDNLKDYLARN
ncbi:inositol transport system substrate-binding protein [Pseudochelatococcus lubricantis]|uniref:Inositol transport system substrate-binding protein n=1 Tax=Pseudochelatococcus lubricantis TaxID=1538102 RepID=A0ABX0UYI9_9HYPH|nr:sugar ABC transporter substrate-binding protein [Pseudochelatococcus lubricantis]NIJ58022.1 inositol transport system substrate-binding protein [Pseudochelatococcus lubricantis]